MATTIHIAVRVSYFDTGGLDDIVDLFDELQPNGSPFGLIGVDLVVVSVSFRFGVSMCLYFRGISVSDLPHFGWMLFLL